MKRKLLSLISILALLLSFGTTSNAQVQVVTCDVFPGSTCYSVQTGTSSFFDVTLTGFNPGTTTYPLMPGIPYQGWCLLSYAPITPGLSYCGAIQRPISGALPSYLQLPNWDVINYLLNNKGTLTPDDVQRIIWNLIEGLAVSPALQPVVDSLLTNGAGFVPAGNQVFGVILDLGSTATSQPVIVEAMCPPPPPPPEQTQYCFRATDATANNPAFILDFGTGSSYLTTSLRLVPVDGTSAMLTGVVYKAGSPSSKFNVNLTLTGYSDPGAQAGWVSYSSMSGTLTGLEGSAGMNLMVSSTGAVQIGNGANGLNPGFGISAPFNWMFTAGGNQSGHGSFAGLATECIDITEDCLVEFQSTGSNHAIYLPGIGTDFIAGNNPLHFVESSDGSGVITGVVYSASNPNKGFSVNISVSGFTTNAPAGSPKKELPSAAYIENSGPIDPSTWGYYTGFTGTLTGLGNYAGAVITVARYGPAFQVGVGANGKNYNDGASGWFTVAVTKQPNSSYYNLSPTSHGDINVDFGPCAPPPPPEDQCLVESKWQGDSVGHALYLPGIATDLIAGNKPLRFVQTGNGNGSITGVVYSASNPSRSFSVNLSVSGFTTNAPAGSPKKELSSSSYIENGGPINPATWSYYTGFTGTLTGLGNYAGAVITVDRYGPAFQVGVGANGKNYNNGASGWFTVTIAKQPSNCGYKLCPTSHGDINVDFGPCETTQPPCVGTGTIGYWKNHPEAWPVESIVIGGKTYTKSQAISIMQQSVSGDKTYSMFPQLVAAKLNVLIGNVSSCISDTITAADAWLVKYPVGSGVSGNSSAWSTGGPLQNKLDDYNNGRLCAPHRDTLNCDGSTPPPTGDPKPTCVPAPWRDTNIGNCNYSGSSSCLNRCYTVKGSGSDIWGNEDDCKYVFQNGYGDCEITAKVSSIDNTDPWAKCGVMIRESMNSDSKHAFACVTAGNGTAFQRRCYTGGSSQHTSGGSDSSWVKLRRTGDTFTCYKSKDGYSWSKVDSCTIKMGSSCYIGLAITSHNNSKTCTATVTNVRVTK